MIESSQTVDFAQLLQLSEVLDGADHLAGVAVLVVIPGHDLHLIGVVVDEALLRKASGAFDMFDLEQFGRLIRCQGSQINVAPNPIAVYRTTIEVYHTDRTKVNAQIYTS